ncbi:hypothetical protein A9Q93_08890 [Nonlabens dokdonensis]|uniref:Uncharacterized protein n=1 Tax=Nonlabens dokdonensis TaxID=328515 RepID=A0A1Z8AU82_9FLAO|nr:hypothetical protein A9Q93_08890 [Nonlabens dokdonensis]
MSPDFAMAKACFKSLLQTAIRASFYSSLFLSHSSLVGDKMVQQNAIVKKQCRHFNKLTNHAAFITSYILTP